MSRPENSQTNPECRNGRRKTPYPAKQKPKHDGKWVHQWYAAAESEEEDEEEKGDDETGMAIKPI